MTFNDLVAAPADGALTRAQRYFDTVPKWQDAVLNLLENFREFEPQSDTPEVLSTATEFADFGGYVDTSDAASQRPPQSALEQFLFHGN